MAYIYDPTSVYIDPTGNENPPYVVDSSTGGNDDMIDNIVGINSWIHTNPISTQIDIKSVADQLSNDKQRPKIKVTTDDLLKGGPLDYAFGRELIDERDKEPTPTPSPSPIDPSSGTSDDPNHWAYDGNKDGVPDLMQWKVI